MEPRPLFSMVNGREVYECGEVKKWRCPSCKTWREWKEEECVVCETTRDGTEGVSE